VDHVTHGQNFTPLAKILYTAGVLPKMPVETVSHEVHVTAPARGVNPEYGEYMANTNDCHLCHGPNMNGGTYPDPTIKKISPNLTPGGHDLDPELMPWKSYRNMSDDELKAIFAYLQSLPKLSQFTQ
jgi:mono/diheme cytochrome c family protein